MTQQTPKFGLTYPEPGDHTRIWEHFQTLAEDTDGKLAGSGGVTAYSPLWRQDNHTVLSIGNGTLSGWYVHLGGLVTGGIVLVRGTTTNAGAEGYQWSLPSNHGGPGTLDYRVVGGTAMVWGSQYRPATVSPVNGQWFRLLLDNGDKVSNTVPGSWSSSHFIGISFQYLTSSWPA